MTSSQAILTSSQCQNLKLPYAHGSPLRMSRVLGPYINFFSIEETNPAIPSMEIKIHKGTLKWKFQLP